MVGSRKQHQTTAIALYTCTQYTKHLTSQSLQRKSDIKKCYNPEKSFRVCTFPMSAMTPKPLPPNTPALKQGWIESFWGRNNERFGTKRLKSQISRRRRHFAGCKDLSENLAATCDLGSVGKRLDKPKLSVQFPAIGGRLRATGAWPC